MFELNLKGDLIYNFSCFSSLKAQIIHHCQHKGNHKAISGNGSYYYLFSGWNVQYQGITKVDCDKEAWKVYFCLISHYGGKVRLHYVCWRDQ